jgi:hypothetical protein
MTFQASRCLTIVAESITFGEMLKNPIKSKAQFFDGRRDGIFYTQKNLFFPFQCLKVRVNNRVGVRSERREPCERQRPTWAELF